jgi:hypothetical protein
MNHFNIPANELSELQERTATCMLLICSAVRRANLDIPVVQRERMAYELMQQLIGEVWR